MTDVVMGPERADKVQPDTFGNLREPKLPGLFRLPLPAAAFLLVSALLAMAVAQVNVIAGIVWMVVAAVAAAPTAFPRKDGVGRYQYAWRRRTFRKAREQGKTTLRQGLTGAVPMGRCALPGVAASTELSSHTDALRREFGLVHWPHAQTYAVVLQANPAGSASLDQSTINDQVAHWAAWLAALNTVPEIVGMAVTVETSPDSGQRLERSMNRGRLPENRINEFAAQVEAQVRELYAGGTPTARVWITLTLTARVDADDDGGGMLRGRDEMADLIGGLLPGWTGSLADTGAGGGVYPCTAQHIIDQTRTQFDPSVTLDVEDAVLSGEGTGLAWHDAGPVWHEVTSTVYRHDHYLSRTWQMQTPPTGVFYAATLEQMLSPNAHVVRKRVTLLYRPETPAASAQAAENDVTAARFKASQGPRAKAIATVELEAAEQTARQEAQGAPLVRVGMVVTITCADEASLRVGSQTVKNSLAAQARMQLREAIGSQDVGFLTGLPLGLVPKTLMAGPAAEPKQTSKRKEW